ncbi:uncharacterized protein LOC100369422 [Saccoglossus kowalevskii]|uniref:Uncharacterized protein LOC100369422 n=1 Tax=Saccoglossus kowalevskii TaxID=10224 RepID=A0ABM0GTI9_SACKO|nr:PREDICTED: uncharacterized protein LOC100369422 [Saccoglossus kowalevskii]
MSERSDIDVTASEPITEKDWFIVVSEFLAVEEFHLKICLILLAILCANIALTFGAWSLYGSNISNSYSQLEKSGGSIVAKNKDKSTEDEDEGESLHFKSD